MIDNSENQLKTEVVIPEVSRTETSNEVFNLQKCIAKAEMPALKKGLSGLERYEVKVSRTVLRGGSDGNVTLLPGERRCKITPPFVPRGAMVAPCRLKPHIHSRFPPLTLDIILLGRACGLISRRSLRLAPLPKYDNGLTSRGDQVLFFKPFQCPPRHFA
jgi:hypothetical protein